MKNAGTIPTQTECKAFYTKVRSFYRKGNDTAQSVKRAMAYVPMHVMVYMQQQTVNDVVRMASDAGIPIEHKAAKTFAYDPNANNWKGYN